MRFFLLLVVSFTLSLAGCDMSTCGADAPEVRFARSLTQERLSALYESTVDLVAESPARIWQYGRSFPDTLADLPLKAIRMHAWGVHYRLQGCMDHWVDLVVYEGGINGNYDPQGRIELWFGEHQEHTREELWNSSSVAR